MAKHLQRDLDALSKKTLQLGGVVESLLNDAILSLTQRREELANRVLADASEVDQREVEIEEDCLKVLALHQPVAVDLRFIVMVLKVNNDLERIGDYAENLANRAKFLIAHEEIQYPSNFIEHMSSEIKNMLHNALQSLVELDVDLARNVIARDVVVDEIHSNVFKESCEMMVAGPEKVDRLMQAISVSRYLERIADLATNIAEDVIFTVEGEVVRHQDKRCGNDRIKKAAPS
ncbi:MAG: phosphate signaling complex protein PhoU [Pseudomonadota bacterium]